MLNPNTPTIPVITLMVLLEIYSLGETTTGETTSIKWLIDKGLISPIDGEDGFDVTEIGYELVDAIIHTPIPTK